VEVTTAVMEVLQVSLRLLVTHSSDSNDDDDGDDDDESKGRDDDDDEEEESSQDEDAIFHGTAVGRRLLNVTRTGTLMRDLERVPEMLLAQENMTNDDIDSVLANWWDKEIWKAVAPFARV
jgi:hypothetical protein